MIAIYDPIEDPYIDLMSFISHTPLIFNVRSTLYIMCPAGPPDEMTRCLILVDDDDGDDGCGDGMGIGNGNGNGNDGGSDILFYTNIPPCLFIIVYE